MMYRDPFPPVKSIKMKTGFVGIFLLSMCSQNFEMKDRCMRKKSQNLEMKSENFDFLSQL